jgi:hypothetical protein
MLKVIEKLKIMTLQELLSQEVTFTLQQEVEELMDTMGKDEFLAMIHIELLALSQITKDKFRNAGNVVIRDGVEMFFHPLVDEMFEEDISTRDITEGETITFIKSHLV